MKKVIAILAIAFFLFPSFVYAEGGYKGKIKENFVFIQTNIESQYPNDEDVTFQVRCRAYRSGIPLSTSIKLYVYDKDGKRLLDTESPNPLTLSPGEIGTVNMGKCEVGLYRAILLAKSGDLQGTLTAQWVVMYPPEKYYFAWRGQTKSMHGAGTVKAEFRSEETYTVKVYNETTNKTEIIEKKKGFDLTFYTFDTGGKSIIKKFHNITKLDLYLDEIYQTGIFCDVEDEHGWINSMNRDPWTGQYLPYHWLGSRKWTASPKWTTEQFIISAIVIIILIIFFSSGKIREWQKERKIRHKWKLMNRAKKLFGMEEE